MQILLDFEGRPVRLLRERLEHILEHPEMLELAGAIALTLERPQFVVASRNDPACRLYYRRIVATLVGEKLLCVVVKVVDSGAFVLTAYLTDRVKGGTRPWPITD